MAGQVKVKTAAALIGVAAAGLVPALASAGEAPKLEGTDRAGSELEGDEVVPGPGSPLGAATLGLDPSLETRRVCWRLKVRGLDTVTGAYLHKGGPAKVGPVRLALFDDADGRAGDGYYRGCVTDVRKRLVRRIFKRKRNHARARGEYDLSLTDWAWYADVTTVEFPAGAVRGQLSAGMPCRRCVLEPNGSAR